MTGNCPARRRTYTCRISVSSRKGRKPKKKKKKFRREKNKKKSALIGKRDTWCNVGERRGFPGETRGSVPAKPPSRRHQDHAIALWNTLSNFVEVWTDMGMLASFSCNLGPFFFHFLFYLLSSCFPSWALPLFYFNFFFFSRVVEAYGLR